MLELNHTHDPSAKSWVSSANAQTTDFPLQNLPLGVFSLSSDVGGEKKGGVAIGDMVFDLRALASLGYLVGEQQAVLELAAGQSLNDLMSQGPRYASVLRHALFSMLESGASAKTRDRLTPLLYDQSEVRMDLPCLVGGFTDFFTSEYHAARAGRISRPDHPLPQAFRHMPMAYNGRASSLQVSGTPAERPWGITAHPSGKDYDFAPSKAMDFELEMGFYVGARTRLGQRLSVDEAADSLFGFCLVNDWSARDIQRAEIFPLGPFLSKSSLTSISPWMVSVEALLPFRTHEPRRSGGIPTPRHLWSEQNERLGGWDIELRAYISTQRSRKEGIKEMQITSSNVKHCYWTFSQMLAHHSSNGCPINPGDLMSSGTVSGPASSSAACMYELCIDEHDGAVRPIVLPNGEERLWLEDGDEIVLRGRAVSDGAVSIGFGDCRGTVHPATQQES